MSSPVVGPNPDVRDPQRIRDAADEILRRAEFQETQGWLGDLQNFLADPGFYLAMWIQELLSIFVGQAGSSAAFIAWALVAIVIFLVVLLSVRLVKNTTGSDVVQTELAIPTDQSRQELLKEAEGFEANADWRRAIRARHAALVASLSEAGVLRRRPGTTAREYASQLRVGAPNAYSSFDAATTLFEWAWYGATAPNLDDVDRFKNLSTEVQRMVHR